MAIFKEKIGHLNFAQKVAQILGEIGVQKISPRSKKSSLNGEISPDLVTLLKI